MENNELKNPINDKDLTQVSGGVDIDLEEIIRSQCGQPDGTLLYECPECRTKIHGLNWSAFYRNVEDHVGMHVRNHGGTPVMDNISDLYKKGF